MLREVTGRFDVRREPGQRGVPHGTMPGSGI
jgi:hypothetical protein